MPQPIYDLIYQLPVAALLLLVVWKFLQFIKDRDQNWLDTIRQRDEYFLSEIKEHQLAQAEQQKETIQVLRENSTAIHQATQVMDRVQGRLDRDDERERYRLREGGG